MKEEESQEQYLAGTPLKLVILRGIKKLVTELTSIKTMFLAFLCVAIAFGWVSDIAGIVAGLAILGVKEIPTETLKATVKKITGEK